MGGPVCGAHKELSSHDCDSAAVRIRSRVFGPPEVPAVTQKLFPYAIEKKDLMQLKRKRVRNQPPIFSLSPPLTSSTLSPLSSLDFAPLKLGRTEAAFAAAVPKGENMQQVDKVERSIIPVNIGELNFSHAEDAQLEAARTRFSNVLKRHGELAEKLSRDSDKTVFERLQREFEAAHASQTQEICLDGEQWNDGLLATIRERVHMEAERKAMILQGDAATVPNLPFHDKITYRVGNKMICCLDGARIGIQYETSYAGEPCELFHCILESKSFLEKMTVLEHTIPFFLPIREAENDYLSSNAMKFIDHLGDLLQAYVDRREQVRLIKELYGNQIGELYCSLPYNMVEFVLTNFDCKITVSLRYSDLVFILPSAVSVLAWPMQQSKKLRTAVVPINKKEHLGNPARLAKAEDALRSMSLPQAFADIVLCMPQALKDVFPQQHA